MLLMTVVEPDQYHAVFCHEKTLLIACLIGAAVALLSRTVVSAVALLSRTVILVTQVRFPLRPIMYRSH